MAIAIATGVSLALIGVAMVWVGLAANPEGPRGWTAALPAWAQVVLIVTIAPATEEALFRGWLPITLAQVMPARVAILCSALAFAVLHVASPIAIQGLMVAGSLVFSALARRFDTLLVPIIAHGTINLISVLS